MFGSDPDDRDHPGVATRRLTGLGLIPDRPGWVPEQPASVPAPLPGSTVPPASAVPPPVETPAAPSLARGAQPTHPLGEVVKAAVADRVPPWARGLVERMTIGGIAWATVVLVVAVIAAVSYLHHHSSAGTAGYSSSTYPAPASASTSATTASSGTGPAGSTLTADPTSIVVDVGGRVRKPGLVTLPAGARVADAITAAGGPLRPKELARVDLAARVTDGQLLLVGVKDATASGDPASGDPAAGSTDPRGSAAPISLSTATLDQLEALPGVGPVTAQKIIDWRTAHSGFTSVEQLQQVPGIGPAHYSEISPLVAP